MGMIGPFLNGSEKDFIQRKISTARFHGDSPIGKTILRQSGKSENNLIFNLITFLKKKPSKKYPEKFFGKFFLFKFSEIEIFYTDFSNLIFKVLLIDIWQ